MGGVLTWVMWLLHTKAGAGAITGFATAAAVDVHVFLSWKKIQDAASWDWPTALLRWAQGTVYGAVVGGGWGTFQ